MVLTKSLLDTLSLEIIAENLGYPEEVLDGIDYVSEIESEFYDNPDSGTAYFLINAYAAYPEVKQIRLYQFYLGEREPGESFRDFLDRELELYYCGGGDTLGEYSPILRRAITNGQMMILHVRPKDLTGFIAGHGVALAVFDPEKMRIETELAIPKKVEVPEVKEIEAPEIDKVAIKAIFLEKLKGGPGSGNFGHAGRPGLVGGSGKGSTVSRGNSQVNTPEFKRWFKDSKVVDAQGKPLVVYHGTPSSAEHSNNPYIQSEQADTGPWKDFDVFKPEYSGTTDSGWLGSGVYFTPDPDFAWEFGDRIIPVYLSVQHPFVINDDKSTSDLNDYNFRKSLEGLEDVPDELKLNHNLTDVIYPKKYGDGEEPKMALNTASYTDENGKTTWQVVGSFYGKLRDYATGKMVDKPRPETVSSGLVEATGSTEDEAITNYNDKQRFYKHGFILHTISNTIGPDKFTAMLKKAGYDGVMSYSIHVDPNTGKEYAPPGLSEVLVYDSTQIKSSIGNRGTFDPNDPSILKEVSEKGGPGSGNYGHAGRPGEVGGSSPNKTARGQGVSVGLEKPVVVVPKRSAENTTWLKPEESKIVNTSISEVGEDGHKHPMSQKDFERVRGMLAAMPTECMNTVSEITFGETDQAFENQVVKAYESEGHIAPDDMSSCYGICSDAEKGKSKITLRPLERIEPDYIFHEIGHAVLNGSQGKGQWYIAYRDPKFDRLTDYSDYGGVKEGFAETFAAYMASNGKVTGAHLRGQELTKWNPRDRVGESFGIVAGVIGRLTKKEFRATLKAILVEKLKGGPGSGNFGHEGRPGLVGGSGKGDVSQGVEKPIIARAMYALDYPSTPPAKATQFLKDHLASVNEAGNYGKVDEKSANLIQGYLNTIEETTGISPEDVFGKSEKSKIVMAESNEAFDWAYARDMAPQIRDQLVDTSYAKILEVLKNRSAPSVLGFYDSQTGLLTLRPLVNDEFFEATDRADSPAVQVSAFPIFLHEYGHAVMAPKSDYSKILDVEAQMWVHRFGVDPNFDRQTSYSKNNAFESFAETFCAYYNANGKNRDKDATRNMSEEFWAMDSVIEKSKQETERIKYIQTHPQKTSTKGGPGSGNFGHEGRPGLVGGSATGGIARGMITDSGIRPAGMDVKPFEKMLAVTEQPERYHLVCQALRDATDKNSKLSEYLLKLHDLPTEDALERMRAFREHDEGGFEDVPNSEVPLFLATEQTRGYVKEQIGEELAKRTGLDPAVIGGVLDSWASTSNTSRAAISLQQAISEEFDSPLSDYQKEVVKDETGTKAEENAYKDLTRETANLVDEYTKQRARDQRFYDSILRQKTEGTLDPRYTEDQITMFLTEMRKSINRSDEQIAEQADQNARLMLDDRVPITSRSNEKKIVRAMYDWTQETLSKAGISELNIYRGVRINKANTSFKAGNDADYQGNAAESWSSSLSKAQNFTGEYGYALAAKVPAKNILCTASTGFGCLSESEFVVMPGKDAKVQVLYENQR